MKNRKITNSIAYTMLLVNLIMQNPNLFAQKNLVPNAGFEIFQNCNPIINYKLPLPWYSPDGGFEYFNACTSNSCCSVPNNGNNYNYQYAHNGNAYIAGWFYYDGFQDTRNYAEVKLLDSLKANHSYYVEFYVVMSDFVKYAVNNIGLLITDTATKINPNANSSLIAANPQILISGNSVISDTMNWIKVSGVYKAHGGEKYITLGNFKDDINTSIILFNINGLAGTGYLIDDVSVIDSALLPVLLSSYHIQQFNHQVINTWQTATEVNVSHFNIQRSSSGSNKDFETVGVVMAKGVGKYEWVDDSPPLSLGRGAGGEALFYRLETVDKDGERMYSDIKKITLTTNNSPLITINPNPAKDYVTIEGNDMQQISIMDALGRLVKRIVPFASSIQIEVKYWAKGVYWIKATNKEGKTVTNKLVVGN